MLSRVLMKTLGVTAHPFYTFIETMFAIVFIIDR